MAQLRLLTALLLLTGITHAADADRAAQADVIVYGATPGGFCAAIAAAREGAKVTLLEPTSHVGGLSTGGLSHCDSNQMRRESLTGLFEEWHRRIVKDYVDRGQPMPYDPMNKTPGIRWIFEPHVAMRVTQTMLKEAGVTVVTQCQLNHVEMTGTRIAGLRTSQGSFTAKTFIDGTYGRRISNTRSSSCTSCGPTRLCPLSSKLNTPHWASVRTSSRRRRTSRPPSMSVNPAD